MKPTTALLLALLAAACAPPAPTTIAEHEDARRADVAFWEEALAAADPAQRAAAARGAGRLRDPALAPALAARLAVEEERPVRREILFALGQSGGEVALATLRAALDGGDPDERALALEALGKCGEAGDAAAIAGALDAAEAEVRGAAALALARLAGRHAAAPAPLPDDLAARAAARLGARLAAGPEESWRAAYALAEIDGLPLPVDALVAASRSEERRTRLFAVRALARAGETPTGALLARLDDADVHVAAAAAAALGELRRGEAAPALIGAAERDAHPQDHHLRQAALRALTALGPPKEFAARIEALAHRDPSPRVREAALSALAHAAPARAAPLIRALTGQADPLLRAAAVRAATRLPHAEARAIVRTELDDADPRVAAAALEALGTIQPPLAREEALRRLAHPDIAVAGTAIDLLARVGRPEDVERAAELFDSATGFEAVELRAAAARAAAALDPATARPLLMRALADPAPAVALAAQGALAGGGATPPPARPGHWHSSAAPWPPGVPAPRARLETTRGAILLELLPEAAPRHVGSFVERARAGKLDGLPFHRVVTGFVVQGLDPRGDGWGTDGVVLRDEIAPLRYDKAGVVGMPNAGPDTGGCQIFITHVPAPHLDGRYTIFARVLSGLDVLDAIDVGDLCERVVLEE